MNLTQKIQKSLLKFAATSGIDILIPNFYINSWEMDVLKVSKSDFIIEYEIKVSRSDFKNDFKKATEKIKRDSNGQVVLRLDGGRGYEMEYELKHDKLLTSKRCNRFYFVVPANLISKAECPKHCGLIYYFDNGTMETIKSAPFLHKDKCSPEIYKQIAWRMAFREQMLKSKMIYENHQLSQKIQRLENTTK